MKYWSRLLPLFLVLALGGCGGQDRQTLQQVDLLLAANEYVQAFAILQAAIHQDPKDKTLRRAEIRLLLQAERVDLAYIRYQDLVNDLSKNDPVLFDLLHDKNETVRTSAVRALGLTGEPEAVPALLGALNDPDQNVRRAAASSLGDLKDVKAVPGLIEALHDKWWFTRSEAAASLGKLRDARAVPPLFAALKDDDQSVRRAAQNALTIIAPDSDPAPFLQALHDSDPAVVYASMLRGTWTGVIHQSELHSDSPYNTYAHAGLPPGPICNPGVAALKAALKPAQTNYLYVVADANGASKFASTLEEHNQNVAAYRTASK